MLWNEKTQNNKYSVATFITKIKKCQNIYTADLVNVHNEDTVTKKHLMN